ncbi:glycosyltransferase family 2 protein, partial [Escherichia coli]|nr:glycosyltransferase family 2 protein [Escherichia coli]ELW1154129.1 glycosyltransferase family 2 protein [Escherichia coli]
MKISKGNQPLLSIVIPCYNEEDVLNETISQLDMFCNKIQDLDIELIFVDDGSKDQTRTILKKYSSRNNKVRIIGFSRNFGHQIAVTAGIDASNGDAVVLIDADLQDPPEVIYQMIDKWREG